MSRRASLPPEPDRRSHVLEADPPLFGMDHGPCSPGDCPYLDMDAVVSAWQKKDLDPGHYRVTNPSSPRFDRVSTATEDEVRSQGAMAQGASDSTYAVKDEGLRFQQNPTAYGWPPKSVG